ncbi:MAG: hypothetical protein A2X18_07065 [Bacteroidetes bacterium GWF2_40_14]|nr:MAG: hypothetical protein A2X18_07065 [Bacteroidetes bacterium GWF2_40_14]
MGINLKPNSSHYRRANFKFRVLDILVERGFWETGCIWLVYIRNLYPLKFRFKIDMKSANALFYIRGAMQLRLQVDELGQQFRKSL